MRRGWSLALFVAALVVAGSSVAQQWPSRPLKLIQPLGVGTPGDVISRAIAQSLSQTFGQPAVVENRVGANGIVGMEACAKAPADGHTICVPSYSQMTMNAVLYSKLPYDPLRDFEPVILVGSIVSLFVVHPSVPAASLRELTDLAKGKPDALNWGSWGLGSFSHLYLAVLKSQTGASFTHVPYKTLGDAMGAVASGEVQALLTSAGAGQSLVKAGRLRPLAVVSKRRSPLVDAPTLEEAGFQMPLQSWVGVTLPTGTPKEIVRRLNAEIAKLLVDPKFVQTVLVPVSVDAAGGTPEDFAAFLKADREFAVKLAKLADLKAE